MKTYLFSFAFLVLSTFSFGQEFNIKHHFTPNIGQFEKINGKEVLYKAVLGNYEVYFTESGFTYRWGDVTTGRLNGSQKNKGNVTVDYLEVKFMNSDKPTTRLEEKSRTLYNFYISNEKRTVSTNGYEQITYENIYPNIDVVFRIPEEGGLKYDFILHSGADINSIQLKYQNITKINQLNFNTISILKGKREFHNYIPESYSLKTDKKLTTEFKVNDSIVSFKCIEYDQNEGMIIDPWETVPSGAISGIIEGEFDNEGNIYCNITIFPGEYRTYKFSDSGTEEWITDITSLGTYYPPDIAVNKATGESYVIAGETTPSDDDIIMMDATGAVMTTYNVTTPLSLKELWRCVYDQCDDRLIIGTGGEAGSGQILTIDNELIGPSISIELDAGGSCIDVAAMDISPDGQNLHLLFPATGTLCGTGPEDFYNEAVKLELSDLTSPIWNTDSELNMLESFCGISNYGGNSGGINGIAIGNEYTYYFNGRTIVQKEESTGLTTTSITLDETSFCLPLMVFGYPGFDMDSTYACSGLAADLCDNLYVGADTNKLLVYDNSLDLLETIDLPGPPVEILYNPIKNVVYAMGGNFIEEIDVSVYSNVFELSSTPYCGACTGSVLVEPVTACVDAGDFEYNWTPGDFTTLEVTDLCADLYTLHVTYGCDTIFSDTISVLLESCEPEIEVEDDTICIDDCTTLFAELSGVTDPYFIDWGDGLYISETSFEVCPTTTTTYEIILQDGSGLFDTTYVTVVVDTIPIFNLGNDTTLCDGETILLDAENPGADYIWQDGSTVQNFEVSTDGEYIVTVTNGECTSSDSISVSYFGALLNLGSDTAFCEIEGFELDVDPVGDTYLWQDGSTDQTYTLSDTGTYYVTITDTLSGCTFSDTIVISAGSIDVNLGTDTIICLPNTLELNPEITPATYEWSEGSTSESITVDTDGTYWVNVTQGICFGADTINVSFQELLAEFSSKDTTFCEEQMIDFNDLSTPNPLVTSWSWNFGDDNTSSDQNPSHSYFTSGEYEVSLVVSSDAGCTSDSSRTINITIYESPIADFEMTPSAAELNEEIIFTNLTEFADSWDWTFGDGATSNEFEPKHTYSEEGNYTVTLNVSNEYCEDEISKSIIIDEPLIFYVPNAFTPDGDNFNATFTPVFTSGFDPYDYHLTVHNRWGETIFESFNSTIGWDGTYSDRGLVEDGVYIWKIEFSDSYYDDKYSYTGHVVLLK